MRAIDCQGFAGGFTAGVAQAGFELVGKRERAGGFGAESVEANRHIVGSNWELQVGEEEWKPVRAELVFGNPPCSGFSQQGQLAWRQSGVAGGADAPINECMRVFARYAGQCDPVVAAFESVQAAFSKGRHLMLALRDIIEEVSGHRYFLYHVLHNAYDLGGCAIRPRYFWTVSRVPLTFTVDRTPNTTTLWDVLSDLVDQPLNRELTRYAMPFSAASAWVKSNVRWPDVRSLDGHYVRDNVTKQRVQWLHDRGWNPGETHTDVLFRLLEDDNAEIDDELFGNLARRMKGDIPILGSFAHKRARADKPSTVLTGASELFVHPTLPRTITLREAYRIQGFPDDWHIGGLSNKAWLYPGKGIPVTSGYWLARTVSNAIAGELPDEGEELRVEKLGDREFVTHTRAGWKHDKDAVLARSMPPNLYKDGSKGAQIQEFLMDCPDADAADAAAAVGCSPGRVYEILRGV